MRNDLQQEEGEELAEEVEYVNCDIASQFKQFCAAHQALEAGFAKFARHEAFGYLTTLPKDLGFFELKVELEIPKITYMLKKSDARVLDILKKYKIQTVESSHEKRDEKDQHSRGIMHKCKKVTLAPIKNVK